MIVHRIRSGQIYHRGGRQFVVVRVSRKLRIQFDACWEDSVTYRDISQPQGSNFIVAAPEFRCLFTEKAL